MTPEQLKKINTIITLTGAGRFQVEEALIKASWDIDLAIYYLRYRSIID